MTERLTVLWTTKDREVAEEMLFLYLINAKMNSWFERAELIIWGPSSKCLSEDEGLQALVEKALDIGVDVKACRVCTERYGVTEKLEKLGITVDYMGVPLSEALKSKAHVLTL